MEGSQHFKRRSRDPFPTLFDIILHFFVSGSGGHAVCTLNLKFLAQTVPEIWRESQNSKSRSRDPLPDPLWPNFSFLSLVPPAINMCAKFEVSCSNHSRDMEGVPKLKKVGHVTPSRSVSRGSSVTPYLSSDPDMPIHYTTFMGLRWRLRVVYSRTSPLLRPFDAKFSKSRRKLAKSFLGKMGSKCKIWFSGPPKGTSLRETTSFDVLIVKIGARVLAVGWRKYLGEGRKGIIVSLWNLYGGRGPRRNHPCKFR